MIKISSFKNIFFIITSFFLYHHISYPLQTGSSPLSSFTKKNSSTNAIQSLFALKPIIDSIEIIGLISISPETIYKKIGLKDGSYMTADKTGAIVRTLYETGYFSNVTLRYDQPILGHVILYIIVEEKPKVASFIIEGNNTVSYASIEKKLSLDKIRSIDTYDMKRICRAIKKMYAEKQYHNATVNYTFEKIENNSVNVIIHVEEGTYGRIKSINFTGNQYVSKKQLREVIGSREYWILGFLDHGGVFRKELVEYDRYQIENFYQSNGFLEAKVLDVVIDESATGDIDICYRISEGPVFNISKITYESDVPIDDFALTNLIQIKKGDLYSKEKLRAAISNIKAFLGECGFMYANVSPKQKINKENNTVALEFIIQKGKQIYIRNINIKGNTKTHNNVIRRELLLNEGELLTTKKLGISKRSVENLGFFTPQTGVNWSLQTLDTHQADLDLIIQEAKTGRFFLNIGVNNGGMTGKQNINGSDRLSWYDSFLTASRIGFNLQDSNWGGKAINYFLGGSYAHVDKSVECGLSSKWLFDYPISTAINGNYRTIRYEDFHQATETPQESTRGGNIQAGFRAHYFDMTLFGLSAGIDAISYKNNITPLMRFPENPLYQYAFSEIVKRSFQEGTVSWLTLSISNDKRNHPVFPTTGYQWIFDSKIALPNNLGENSCNSFGFIKTGFDLHWYTPIIIEYNVILHLHGYAGFIYRMDQCNVPYKELFHIGGQQTVRGFLFGQIGPTLLGSSLGSSKAFFVNSEIHFPINKAASLNGVLFYDGGAAWDTIFDNPTISAQTALYSAIESTSVQHLIQNNEINYRHSVGIGIRLTAPMPLRIDWGFKLDHNRRLGERPYEFHISMEASY